MLPLYPPSLLPQLSEDDLISIDYDSVLLQIVEAGPNYWARVISGGVVRPNSALAIVGRASDLPPLTDVDYAAIEIGLRLDIKHIALSFANKPEDVELLRRRVGKGVEVIAKIESSSGLENLSSIIDAADAILIDRGDLSREVALETLPFVQKHIIRSANEADVPVYVATNLLESMVSSPRPTRAEVNDVVNTLMDGADGLVLAAETAVGKFPVQCVSMVRSLIEQHQASGSEAGLAKVAAAPSLVITAHGGHLVNRVALDLDQAAAEDLPQLEVGQNVLMDVEQIGIGAFSPLEGFMGREVLEDVLGKNRLPDGTVWPMPVLLQLPGGVAPPSPVGETVMLTAGGQPKALLHLEEIFDYDLSHLALKWFGTDDSAHPGVASLLQSSNTFLAGKVDLLPGANGRRRHHELTPAQTRVIFQRLQWHRVIGFHTRNVAHRAHEHLQLTALEDYHGDGVFIHPVIGPKKTGDFSSDIILKSYEYLLANHYPQNKMVLGGFATYSRYAGPREAVFTALCRKNFGCSHFIVGRDHTGVGDFYPADASQRLFDELGDMAIEPIFFNEVYYCQKCAGHVDHCGHGQEFIERISGTQAREMLSRGEGLPDWYMRTAVSNLILEDLKDGKEVFIS